MVKRIRPVTLDMKIADGNYVKTKMEVVTDALKERGKYRPDLLYRGFSGDNIPEILKEGTDRTSENTTFCATEAQITTPGILDGEDIFYYAEEQKQPAIAVFNPDEMIYDCASRYRFRHLMDKKRALVAVFRLKY